METTRPLLQVQPHLQPGPFASELRDGEESIVLAWQTNRVPANFTVTFAPKGEPHGKPQEPRRAEHYNVKGQDGKDYFRYSVALTGLRLSSEYEYHILLNGHRFAEGVFTTRKKRGKSARFVVFGDNSFGDIADRHISYQAFQQTPDFVVNTGDMVYDNGLANEFTRLFFPVHNADIAHPRVGAPLLRSVLFYTVIGNHDMTGDNVEGIPCLDLNVHADAGGYYTCLHLPENGPEKLTYPTLLEGSKAQVEVFRQNAGSRFPRMANFSFDFGDAHFLCLDSNFYVDPTDHALQEWIEHDLSHTDAVWKLVVWHHPAFNLGRQHFANQHMRVLSPILEKHGVAVAFHGHEHVYQRTRPLKFAPQDVSRAHALGSSDRMIPGTFTIDRSYDGIQNTVPNGVIYVVTGAGGKYLYNREQHNTPGEWTHAEDDHADYGAKYLCERHSLTVVDMDDRSLTIRQIDDTGEEIDRFRITHR